MSERLTIRRQHGGSDSLEFIYCSAEKSIKRRDEIIEKLAAYEDAEEQGRLVVLPCKVGDTVFAFLSDAPTKKRTLADLSECIIYEILINRDYAEPHFTAMCYEKAEYERFFLRDFGTEIFTVEQFFNLAQAARATERSGDK